MDFIESKIHNTKTKIESIKINICRQINNPIFYLIFVLIYSENAGSVFKKSNAKKSSATVNSRMVFSHALSHFNQMLLILWPKTNNRNKE